MGNIRFREFCLALFLMFFTTFWLVFFHSVKQADATDIRKPVWAGSFYPASKPELEKTIYQLSLHAKQTKVQFQSGKILKALILPHAGYIYSGLTAAHASLVLKEKQFSKVVLLGPDHRVGFRNGSISDYKAYQTPLGIIELHEDNEILRLQSDVFQTIPASDMSEHSLEVILPFLQSYLKEFKIVPVVLGPGHIVGITDAIDPILDQNTLVVASSDLSHYLSYAEAVAKDKKTINMILNLEYGKLSKCSDCACGKMPILIVMEMALRHGWQPVLLHYSNSGDTAGGKTQVVGYAAIAFYGDLSMKKTNDSSQHFNQKHGQALVKLARKTIMERFGQKMAEHESDSLSAVLKDRCFHKCCGTFVTLKINDQLRGCIGNLTANESVLEGVRRNAINAAFHDPRFSPLIAKELENVDIEVSILTEPKLLEYRDSSDLLSKLRVNVDGVIIRKGSASATFLPQVWEQLPKSEEFLAHLCMKAGLPANTWKKDALEVKTYQVQYFDEEK